MTPLLDSLNNNYDLIKLRFDQHTFNKLLLIFFNKIMHLRIAALENIGKK